MQHLEIASLNVDFKKINMFEKFNQILLKCYMMLFYPNPYSFCSTMRPLQENPDFFQNTSQAS
eukprot:UN07417